MRANGHPNEPGRWTLLESREGLSLWRRDRADPMPVTMFYLLNPPTQAELIYDEARARDRFAVLFATAEIQDPSARTADAPA